MIISAVALMAFSIAGMASEVNKVEMKTDCKKELSVALNHAYSSGMDADDSWQYALAIYDLCETGALDAIYSIKF